MVCHLLPFAKVGQRRPTNHYVRGTKDWSTAMHTLYVFYIKPREIFVNWSKVKFIHV